MIPAIITYIAVVIFIGRFAWHIMSWVRAGKGHPCSSVAGRMSARTIAETAMDIIFFRRLFRTNRLLWAASWTFHVSFILVILRHLRYFTYPVPGFIVSMQDTGITTGYLLAISLILILIIRSAGGRDRYISIYNIFLIVTLLLTSLTGLLMTLFFRTDLVDIKAYMLGILSFSPEAMPDSLLFIIHYILALLLIPSLPFHLIAAPVITMEARRRDDGPGLLIHEK